MTNLKETQLILTIEKYVVTDNRIRAKSKGFGLFETGEICDAPPHILTLITCSYEWNGTRNVVVAVGVKCYWFRMNREQKS